MLTQINPINLSRTWHMIKPGIEEILDNLNAECEQEFWTPEDVYVALKTNNAVLLLSDDGFVVVQVRNDVYTGIKQFFVWMAYSFDPNKEIMLETQPFLYDLAKQWGCEMMSFSSNRIGFRKKAKEMGYTTGPTTYTMRI